MCTFNFHRKKGADSISWPWLVFLCRHAWCDSNAAAVVMVPRMSSTKLYYKQKHVKTKVVFEISKLDIYIHGYIHKCTRITRSNKLIQVYNTYINTNAKEFLSNIQSHHWSFQFLFPWERLHDTASFNTDEQLERIKIVLHRRNV